jgi:hypothetical protein
VLLMAYALLAKVICLPLRQLIILSILAHNNSLNRFKSLNCNVREYQYTFESSLFLYCSFTFVKILS